MSEPKISRRAFLGAAFGAGAAATACSDPADFSPPRPPVPGAEKWRRGQERSIATACAQCDAGCGIKVRVVEARAVGIAPLEGDPVGGSRIGARGLSGLQTLYDPDRIRTPLRRRGPRGSGDWQSLSWDEALDVLGSRLTELRQREESHRLAIVCGRERGLVRDLWIRFAKAYGTPNFLDTTLRRRASRTLAAQLTRGVPAAPAHDWASARVVLSLGAPLLEESCQGIRLARSMMHHRHENMTMHGEVFHADAAPSQTSAAADEWLRIRPGSHGALALGLAHVMIRDEIFDRAFVKDHCHGFDDWIDADGTAHEGFASRVLRENDPVTSATSCGIEAGRIERLAHHLVTEGPSFAVLGDDTASHWNGVRDALATEALNALLGAIERPGGVLTQRDPPLEAWPEPTIDEFAERALARPALARGPLSASLAGGSIARLPEALESGHPYSIDTLLLHYANPCHAWSGPRRWQRALARVPFIVSFSPFMDDTVDAMADLVLPDHTYLERFEDSSPAPGIGRAVFGLRQPVVVPQHDTRATADAVISLAGRLGDSVSASFQWKNFRSVVLGSAAGLRDLPEGDLSRPSKKKFLRSLSRRGFWAERNYPYDRANAFATPSKRFEFSPRLPKVELPATSPWHPSFEETDTLTLDIFTPSTHAEGSGANQPMLQELVLSAGDRPWERRARISAVTAARLGVGEGDRISIQNEHGRIEMTAHLDRDLPDGLVRIPLGGGHRAFGRYAAGRGANPLELTAGTLDATGEFAPRAGLRVHVERIT